MLVYVHVLALCREGCRVSMCSSVMRYECVLLSCILKFCRRMMLFLYGRRDICNFIMCHLEYTTS